MGPLMQQIETQPRLKLQPCTAQDSPDQAVVEVHCARRHRRDRVEATRPVEPPHAVEGHLRRRLHIESVAGPGVPLAPELRAHPQPMVETQETLRLLAFQTAVDQPLVPFERQR